MERPCQGFSCWRCCLMWLARFVVVESGGGDRPGCVGPPGWFRSWGGVGRTGGGVDRRGCVGDRGGSRSWVGGRRRGGVGAACRVVVVGRSTATLIFAGRVRSSGIRRRAPRTNDATTRGRGHRRLGGLSCRGT